MYSFNSGAASAKHVSDIDGLVQKRCNSIADALELHLCCIKWSTYPGIILSMRPANETTLHCNVVSHLLAAYTE